MNVTLMKQSSDTVTYGEEQTLEVIRLTNVTRIDYVENSGEPYYAITHKTGSDASAHTTNYDCSDYILAVEPSIN